MVAPAQWVEQHALPALDAHAGLNRIARRAQPFMDRAGDNEEIRVSAHCETAPTAHARRTSIRPDNEARGHPLAIAQYHLLTSAGVDTDHLGWAAHGRAGLLGQPYKDLLHRLVTEIEQAETARRSGRKIAVGGSFCADMAPPDPDLPAALCQ